MPLYDYVCPLCAHHTEELFPVHDCPASIPCTQCGWAAEKVICFSPTGVFREDAAWIRTVCDVVDKKGGEHCQRFLAEPTRSNYRAWMKKEGVRPVDPSELTASAQRRRERELDAEHRQRTRRAMAVLPGLRGGCEL